MRIVTWNCRRGPLAIKRAALEAFAADIIVLTEASRPKPDETDVLWFGEGKYGVAVVAKPPFAVTRADSSSLPCVYPISVSGPETFTLFAVWTWEAPTYKGALMNGLDAYANLPKPWVFAGDFNGNVRFDRPRAKAKWRDCFARLEAEGLVSAYHVHTGAVPGEEPDPTHYFRTHHDKPFHIDYCYIPAAWAERLEEVRIASFDEFAALSDHRPLSITLRTT